MIKKLFLMANRGLFLKLFSFSITAFALTSAVAQSAIGAKPSQSRLSLQCEQDIVDVVYDKYGRHDETFSVYGYTIIYKSHYLDLAVVRTSDEVEPRDVLVSVEEAQQKSDRCKVKIKEVLADGMVAELDDVLIELKQTPSKLPGRYIELTGTIHSVLSGEIHPFVLGDACVIEVKDALGELTALVTDMYSCDENQESLKEGKSIKVLVHKKDLMDYEEENLSEVSDLFESRKFYQVPFANIKL